MQKQTSYFYFQGLQRLKHFEQESEELDSDMMHDKCKRL